MGPRIRMLDDSREIVIRHRVRPGTRSIDLWLVPMRTWWSTPVWVRLLPLLLCWPIVICGPSVIAAWERLMTGVGHKLWLANHDSGILNIVLFIVIPAAIVILGLFHAPLMIITVITTHAIHRRSDPQDRTRGVCIACRYEFGQLPPATIAIRGTWVICPECGAAWDPDPGYSPTSQARAGYRSLLAWGLRSFNIKRLTLGEKAAIAAPLAVILILTATLAAHGYLLSRPDLFEWIMKYHKGSYWTVMFLPSLVPLGYLLISSVLSGRAVIARLIPLAPTRDTPVSTPHAT